VPAFPKPSTDFTLPLDVATPLLLIGPGTGGGAFVGFLQRRRALLASAAPDVPRGPCWMVYGCRRRDHDHLFPTELDGFAAYGRGVRAHLRFG
jgi:sulfite reductase alpha subunit-like flavoprotein